MCWPLNTCVAHTAVRGHGALCWPLPGPRLLSAGDCGAPVGPSGGMDSGQGCQGLKAADGRCLFPGLPRPSHSQESGAATGVAVHGAGRKAKLRDAPKVPEKLSSLRSTHSLARCCQRNNSVASCLFASQFRASASHWQNPTHDVTARLRGVPLPALQSLRCVGTTDTRTGSPLTKGGGHCAPPQHAGHRPSHRSELVSHHLHTLFWNSVHMTSHCGRL